MTARDRGGVDRSNSISRRARIWATRGRRPRSATLPQLRRAQLRRHRAVHDHLAVLLDDDVAAAQADEDAARERAEADAVIESVWPESDAARRASAPALTPVRVTPASPARHVPRPNPRCGATCCATTAPNPSAAKESAMPTTPFVRYLRAALGRAYRSLTRRGPAARPDPRTTAHRPVETVSAPPPIPATARADFDPAGHPHYRHGTALIRRGYNITKPPYGYRAEPAGPHRRARLVPDPQRARVVTQIFTWRVRDGLDIADITTRLRRDPHQYPPPGRGRWSDQSVTAVLTNPRYTGHQVWLYRDGTTGLTPPDRWVVSHRAAHPALATLTTYFAAQNLPEHTKAVIRQRLRHQHRRSPR
ncbi:MAG: recombinase family protein [Thermocrispum sp.]